MSNVFTMLFPTLENDWKQRLVTVTISSLHAQLESMGRTRIKESGGRRPVQFKNSTPTYEFRLQVVQFFEANKMPATLQRFFPGIAAKQKATKRKSIYLWVKNKERIEKAGTTAATRAMKKLRARGSATILSGETELELVRWINEHRLEGAPVSALMLQLKALEFARATGVAEGVFSATYDWRTSFLRRHALRFRARTRQGQLSPADGEAATKALNESLRQEMHDLGVDEVFNADQTPVFFEYVPKSTIDKKGVSTVWVKTGGKSKERLTCMLLGSSFGKKSTPFLILKTRPAKDPETRRENTEMRHGFGKHVWKEIKQLQASLNVQIYSNATGWWNTDMSITWLDYHFKERPFPNRPVLLLWDDFSAHWTTEVVEHSKTLNVRLLPVPPGHTATCQPADIAWNRPLKHRLRQHWLLWLTDRLAFQDVEGCRKGPARKVVVDWVVRAWEDLSTATISNGFSGILSEPVLDDEEGAAFTVIAEQLENLNLLDASVGEVRVCDDIVDKALAAEGAAPPLDCWRGCRCERECYCEREFVARTVV
jgi:hypothetical protein